MASLSNWLLQCAAKMKINKTKEKKKPNFRINGMAILLVIAVLAVIISIYSKDKPKIVEAEKLTDMIVKGNSIGLASNGVLNEQKLEELQSMSYEELKESLNAK